MVLCEDVLNSKRAPPSVVMLFQTLMCVYLADGQPEAQGAQIDELVCRLQAAGADAAL